MRDQQTKVTDSHEKKLLWGMLKCIVIQTINFFLFLKLLSFYIPSQIIMKWFIIHYFFQGSIDHRFHWIRAFSFTSIIEWKSLSPSREVVQGISTLPVALSICLHEPSEERKNSQTSVASQGKLFKWKILLMLRLLILKWKVTISSLNFSILQNFMSFLPKF